MSEALEAEHHRIDESIETFAAGVADGLDETRTLREALTLLRRHIYIEEEFVFPPLKEGGTAMSILVMEREHGELWRLMDELERLVAADTDAETLLGLCRQFLELLEKHNMKEEPIVYPEADLALSGTSTQELHEFLVAGVMPEGWVCARA